MKNTMLLRAVGDVGDDLIERAAPKARAAQIKKKIWLRWAIPVAACLAITLIVTLPLMNDNNDSFNLSRSTGVKVEYLENPPTVNIHASLVYLSEKELFATHWMGIEIVAFAGEVIKVDNIAISYGNEHRVTEYKAIAHIRVSEVFRGNIQEGSVLTVLLPGPVGSSDIYVSDTGISSLMTVGTTGIFMPFAYNEESGVETDGSFLSYLDLADYGFGDGVRWAFLQKGDEVVFARHYAYESISNATTMEEIRQYVISMLER